MEAIKYIVFGEQQGILLETETLVDDHKRGNNPSSEVQGRECAYIQSLLTFSKMCHLIWFISSQNYFEQVYVDWVKVPEDQFSQSAFPGSK